MPASGGTGPAMKTKVLAAILGIVIGGTGVAIFSGTPPPEPTVPVPPAPAPVPHEGPLFAFDPEVESPASDSAPAVDPTLPAAISVPPSADDSDPAERVRQRVEQLMVLAMNNDRQSRDAIWAEV